MQGEKNKQSEKRQENSFQDDDDQFALAVGDAALRDFSSAASDTLMKAKSTLASF